MWLISCDLQSLGERVYYRFLPDQYTEIRDPRGATVFHTKKAAKSAVKKMVSMKEYAEIVDQKEHVERFKQDLRGWLVRRGLPYGDPKYNVPYDPNKHSKTHVLNWHIFHAKSESKISYEIYETYPDLYEVFNHIREVETYRDDIQGKVMSFSMEVNKNSKLKEFKNELDCVKDLVTLKDSDGRKQISIFDHYLCAHGNSAEFLIWPDNKTYSIEENYCGEAVRGDLKTVFKYWKKNRYYK